MCANFAEKTMIYTKLNDGRAMPLLGYGTYKVEGDADPERCVSEALEVGYRLIDTATLYRNEAEIGKALCKCGIPRDELFVTTKLWTNITNEKEAFASIERSLEQLRLDFVDLLLIHWPTAHSVEVYEAMLKIRDKGLAKSIGVSNFKQHHLEQVIACGVMPAVNQVELHPIFQQKDLRKYCADKNIVVQAWSPLMRSAALNMDELTAIAAKYGVTVAQLILRWNVQSGIATVPKTTNKSRMIENFCIFGFEISEEDMRAIDALDQNARQYRDPDNHGF